MSRCMRDNTSTHSGPLAAVLAFSFVILALFFVILALFFVILAFSFVILAFSFVILAFSFVILANARTHHEPRKRFGDNQ